MIAERRPVGHAQNVMDISAVRVLIVDDQEPFRMAARTVVQVARDFVLVGEAGSGEEGVAAVAELAPEVVLMDINMPGIDGIEATARLVAEHPGTIVILMSTYAAEALPAAARESAAARYVHKEDLSPALLREVWAERDRSVPD